MFIDLRYKACLARRTGRTAELSAGRAAELSEKAPKSELPQKALAWRLRATNGGNSKAKRAHKQEKKMI